MRAQWLAGIAVLAATMLPAVEIAASSASCGGIGGNLTESKQCPAGQYAVGITARGSSYVDSFGIQCAPFNSAGVRDAVAKCLELDPAKRYPTALEFGLELVKALSLSPTRILPRPGA